VGSREDILEDLLSCSEDGICSTTVSTTITSTGKRILTNNLPPTNPHLKPPSPRLNQHLLPDPFTL
jgi:hypothetical protein